MTTSDFIKHAVIQLSINEHITGNNEVLLLIYS